MKMTWLRRFAWQMRIFKNKPFNRFARKGGLDDPTLCEAIANAVADAVGMRIQDLPITAEKVRGARHP